MPLMVSSQSIKSDVFSSGVLVLDIVRGGGGWECKDFSFPSRCFQISINTRVPIFNNCFNKKKTNDFKFQI